MKKVLLSLLAVAALVLSCQNYDDEFAALNTKIASLESQITSLAELRTAVTGVQSSISALQTAVAAAQAAAEAADNSDAITALATSVAAIAADLVDLQTAIDGATTEADLDALKAELNTTLAALQTLIETNSASISSLILSNTELKDALDELGVDVDSVLASNASFEGSLTITNAAELAYAKSLGNKVATINGNVYVLVDSSDHTSGGTGEGLTAEEVNPILSQITFVVGNVKIDTDEELDLSKLASVSGDYIVLNHDVKDDALLSVGDDVYFSYDGPYTSKIETVDNIYLVMKPSFAGSATAAAEVGTTSVDFMALKKGSGVQSVLAANTAGHTSGGSLSTGEDTDTKTIVVAGGNTTVATTNTNATTSIKIGQAPVVGVTGKNRLTTVELHYAADLDATTNPNGSVALGSLSVTGDAISSLTVMAAKITGDVTVGITKAGVVASGTASFPELTSAGAIESDALVTTLTKLKTAGGIQLDYDAAVSLPALTSSTGNIVLTRASSFSAPNLTRVAAKIATGDTEADTAGADITANLVTGELTFSKLTKAGNVSLNAANGFIAPNAKISSISLADADVTVASGVASVLVGTTVDVKSVSPQPLADVGSGATLVDVDTATYGVITTNTTNLFANASTITTLKLGAQDLTLDLNAFALATTISYSGAADTAGLPPVGDLKVGSDNVILSSLTLGGTLGVVSVITDNTQANADEGTNDATSLSTITTSGTIEELTIQNNFDLTTVNALHTDSTTNSTAAILVVENNPNLTTLKTGITTFSDISIVNNYKLSSLDLSSIVSLPANWAAGDAIDLDITNNFIDASDATVISGQGDYAAVYGFDSADLDEEDLDAPLSTYLGMKGSYQAESSVAAEKYFQSGLATLSTFFDSLEAKFINAETGASKASSAGIAIDLDYKWVNTSDALQTAEFSVSGNTTSTESVDEVVVSRFRNLLKIQ